jgi:CRISPR/Cas system CSM-associated protein Csm5 (group 7 of RAMP superfamily)
MYRNGQKMTVTIILHRNNINVRMQPLDTVAGFWFEKLECLDNTDFDNIKEIIHAQNVEDGSEMRELVSILIGRLSWCLVK